MAQAAAVSVELAPSLVEAHTLQQVRDKTAREVRQRTHENAGNYARPRAGHAQAHGCAKALLFATSGRQVRSAGSFAPRR